MNIAQVLLSPHAVGGVGDRLYLTGNDVLIRAGPGPTHPVIMTLNRGQDLTELERQGDWIRVRVEQPDAGQGWVHAFFVQSAEGEQPREQPPRDSLESFRRDVEDFNTAARRLSGASFFTAVEPVGPGAVQLHASKNWLSLRPAERDRMLDQLFRLWSGYHGKASEAAVYVVDTSGRQVMQRKRR